MQSTDNDENVSLHGEPDASSGEKSKASAGIVNISALKIRSFLAEGDEIYGDIQCKQGVRIAGYVDGNVECETGSIVIDATGVVTGSLFCKESIFINGRVGNAQASLAEAEKVSTPGLVVLLDGALVFADIEYGKLATYGDMTHHGSTRRMGSS